MIRNPPLTTYDIAAKVLESQSIYVVLTDLEGKYTYLNNYFCEKFGIDADQMIGTDSMLNQDKQK